MFPCNSAVSFWVEVVRCVENKYRKPKGKKCSPTIREIWYSVRERHNFPLKVGPTWPNKTACETGIIKTRNSVPACWNILKGVEDLPIVADFTEEPLLAAEAAAVHVWGGKFNDLAQERSQLSLYHLQKERRDREDSENRNLADEEYWNSFPLRNRKTSNYNFSAALRKKRHSIFTPKEPFGLNHWRLENEDVETSFVFFFLCSVEQGIEGQQMGSPVSIDRLHSYGARGMWWSSQNRLKTCRVNTNVDPHVVNSVTLFLWWVNRIVFHYLPQEHLPNVGK